MLLVKVVNKWDDLDRKYDHRHLEYGFTFIELFLYIYLYQVSFGPISWLMVSEIFPLRTRGRGISLAVLTNFGSNALVTFAFSPLKVLYWEYTFL